MTEAKRINPDITDEDIARDYGSSPDAVRQRFRDAKEQKILLLDVEGTYEFTLDNGARLKVFASPFTPCSNDDDGWGFQYASASTGRTHEFDIPDDTDMVITHGPPKGILDMGGAADAYAGIDRQPQRRRGCPSLFEAVSGARPRLHCFGHAHRGWGAKMVRWRANNHRETKRTHFNTIDCERSAMINNLDRILEKDFDDPRTKEDKAETRLEIKECGVIQVGGFAGDGRESTLFVNAAYQGTPDSNFPVQVPWLVNIDLLTVPRKEEE